MAVQNQVPGPGRSSRPVPILSERINSLRLLTTPEPYKGNPKPPYRKGLKKLGVLWVGIRWFWRMGLTAYLKAFVATTTLIWCNGYFSPCAQQRGDGRC